MKILVLGASGMIGSAIFKLLSEAPSLEVWGSLRDEGAKNFFSQKSQSRLLICKDSNDSNLILKLFNEILP